MSRADTMVMVLIGGLSFGIMQYPDGTTWPEFWVYVMRYVIWALTTTGVYGVWWWIGDRIRRRYARPEG